eukprot:TRINITY_DN19438_c0_g1_i1.p1 TRINITY_DN19438_c0_g1~~TRINITY_DN19438_c0_g1_i1.p1  ORF type:complete len:470 (-),score=40.00 TRINITY_DN19438_c0_g1_i1:117-1472(-)
MARAFEKVQDAWALKLISDQDLCDAVAVLGHEAVRVPFLSALLANISSPLKQALQGQFREGVTRELVLPHVTPCVFQCILRAAAHLDPELNADNVVPTWKAAKLYMITDLANVCISFMEDSIAPEAVLTVLSASETLGEALPGTTQRALWKSILLHSEKVVFAPSFILAHGAVIDRLLRLDELEVSEVDLWLKLVAWASSAQADFGRLGPVSDAVRELQAAKRRRTDDSATSDSPVVNQTTILQYFADRVRFATMPKAFFCNKAMPFLSKEVSEEVLVFHLLGRAPKSQITSKRSGLCPTEERQSISTRTSVSDPNAAEALKLARGATWQATKRDTAINVELSQTISVTQVVLVFWFERKIWPAWTVDVIRKGSKPSKPEWESCPGSVRTVGRVHIMTIDREIAVSRLRVQAQGLVGNLANYAAVNQIEVHGKKLREGHAADVVNRLFPDT